MVQKSVKSTQASMNVSVLAVSNAVESSLIQPIKFQESPAKTSESSTDTSLITITPCKGKNIPTPKCNRRIPSRQNHTPLALSATPNNYSSSLTSAIVKPHEPAAFSASLCWNILAPAILFATDSSLSTLWAESLVNPSA